VYSRNDGVVAWQSCQHEGEAVRDNVDDFEVDGSHLGMGWNPDVLQVVGERLALRRPLRAAA